MQEEEEEVQMEDEVNFLEISLKFHKRIIPFNR